MDKLKPILANKFWILWALALVLPPSGWFLGARKLVGESLVRKAALEVTFGKAKLSGAVPNQSWADAVKKRAATQNIYFRSAAARLWNAQKHLMVWPRTVASLMSGAEYRKPAADQLTAANNFRSAYYAYLQNIWKIADPVNYPTPAGQARTKDHIGKIMLQWATIPKVAEGTWRELPPTANEMWDAQEDVWLVAALLHSIAEVNRSATNIADASIRQIQTLKLKGGSRGGGSSGGGSPGGGGSFPRGGFMMGGDDDPEEMFGLAGGMGMGMSSSVSSRGRTGGGSVDFSLEDEFGSATATRPPADSSDDSGANTLAGMGMRGMRSFGERRYIDDDPDLPFKTRGFYIKVLMDHRRLPELVAALTNSPFPIEVVRIHQQDAQTDSSGGAARKSGSGFGGRAAGLGRSGPRPLGAGLGQSFARRSSAPGMSRARSRGGIGIGGLAQTNPDAQLIIQQALADPELSYVTLQGVMTLYLPPGFEQPSSGADGGATSLSDSASAGTSGSEPGHPPLPTTTQSSVRSNLKRTSALVRPPLPGQPSIPGDAVKPGTASGSPPKPGIPVPPTARTGPSGS